MINSTGTATPSTKKGKVLHLKKVNLSAIYLFPLLLPHPSKVSYSPTIKYIQDVILE
jgi:hypothetical protein